MQILILPVIALDRVQFQSHHIACRVPAGEGVRRPQGRHMGPERDQDTATSFGHCLCRYGLPRCTTQWLFLIEHLESIRSVTRPLIYILYAYARLEFTIICMLFT